ncbi:TPA: type III secretion target, IpaC/SipC family protein [Providencia rettgeri]|uniref:type III secretion target, IpaC/SipC family protein n=1 Tax=Providencia TaxID=586 RepID=UPI001B9C70B2|nr:MULTISPECIES: type III secretion target, IpaC/SipC family protein [Providencia]MDK7744966.1 type III secretion target, IpaC/SipC family protein [Providencia rettgeri]MDK7757542.1 type III secretion target, IpaC/SipC family protein [Providencia rettgeri]HBC7431067.1 type III secretion target, IpaC/SipC family protein [Providencia rettgeri]
MSFNIQSESSKPVLLHKPISFGSVSSTTNSNTKAAEMPALQGVQLNDVHTMALGSEMAMDKPSLKMIQFSMQDDQMLAEISSLTNSDKLAILDDLHAFRMLTPESIQQAISKVLTEEKSHIEQLVEDAQLPDEADLKQISQAIQAMIAGSFLKDSASEQVEGGNGNKDQESIGSIKNNTFVGIISNDLLVELSKIIRKVMAEINISDRRINADFLQLNAKMVQASADSTVREGKEAFKGALMGFVTSLAITAAGSGFQARGLRQQQKSINNNLVAGNQNISGASQLSGLNGKVGSDSMKSKTLSLTGKDGSTVTLSNQASQSQKNLSSQRVEEAGRRTRDLGVSQHEKHEQVMNKTRVQMGVADQVSRMSDNAGQLATTSNQVNVKSAEADKMIEQSVADTARSIYADKDKQIDKSQDLMKQIQEHLREIREGILRTVQSVVRG